MLYLWFELKTQRQTNVLTAEKFKNSELRHKVSLCVSYISHNKHYFLHSTKAFVFITDRCCVQVEVQSEYLYTIQVKVSLQQVHFYYYELKNRIFPYENSPTCTDRSDLCTFESSFSSPLRIHSFSSLSYVRSKASSKSSSPHSAI